MSLRRADGPRAPGSAAAVAIILALTTGVAHAYTVRPGDTLWELARRTDSSVSTLARLNDLPDASRIYAGQTLRLPGGSQGGGSGPGTHTVTRGETLSEIADRHGMRVRDLAALNGIEHVHRIFAGQRLRLSASPSASEPHTHAVSPRGDGPAHVVSRGETLSGIAVRYGVAVRSLARLNGLRDADVLIAGRRLRLPGAARPSETSSSAASDGAVSGETPTDIEAVLEHTAQRYGWNPAFVKALAWQESGWSNGVVSSVGARGVMQVLPSTSRFVAAELVGRPLNLSDPRDNVEAGVAFLDYLHRLTGGDAEMVLAGYYQGLESVRENGMYPSTRRYIDNVFALRARFG